jgi:hypothetical protein
MAAWLNYYPPNYQEWLFGALDLSEGDELRPELLEPLFGLSREFRADSAPAPDYFADSATLRAYTLYYMSINMPKLWFLLDRVPALDVREVRDCGCGPGTFLWAYVFWLMHRRPEALAKLQRLHGVERTPEAAAMAQRLGKALRRLPGCGHLEIEISTGDWEADASDAELTIFGNVLVEGETSALPCPTGKRLILIEPGDRAGFHKLLPHRDALLEQDWQVRFPCTSHHSCPMAADNWCHFAVNRFVLPFVQRMSTAAKRRNHRHHFSGFVLDAEGTHEPDHWRVLSNLRKANRSGIRYICDGERLIEGVLNRKARTPQNRGFLDAEWGDRLHMTPSPKTPRLNKALTVTCDTEIRERPSSLSTPEHDVQ